ncbi:MAG: hypothetical protein ABJD07_10875 [Gemmatimonadaceae bacterium]
MPIIRQARGLAALSMLVALAACAGDGTGPRSATFDATRAQADVEAVQAAFAAPAVRSFAAMGARFGADGGFSASVAGTRLLGGVAAVTAGGDHRELTRAAIAIAGATLRSAASIPAAARGKTFVYDASAQQYVVSARAGAPADGARFILYAIDPLTQAPVMASEVGYADVIDLAPSGPLSVGLRLVVVGSGTTYLDYTIAGTATSLSAATIAVAGFVTDGTTRVNFSVTATAAVVAQQTAVKVAFSYTVPSRSLTVTGAAQEVVSGATAASQIELTIQSGGSTVRYVFVGTGDTLDVTVSVNGSLFAHITGTFEAPTITGAGGHTLTAGETAALGKLLALASDAFAFLDHLFAPVGAIGI